MDHLQYSTTTTATGSEGRAVRIYIPRNESLSLAEVQVFDHAGNNIALNQGTIQSSTFMNPMTGVREGVASRAVDEHTDGWGSESTTHTVKSDTPYWYVDFGSVMSISKIVIYNRTDCCQERLNDAIVEVLNTITPIPPLPPPPPSPVVDINAVHSGKCLDVSASGLDNGVNVQQWECHGMSSQAWELVPDGNYLQIKSVVSGKCLDIVAVSMANGGTVHQWECYGGTNQKWELVPIEQYF